MVGYYVLLEERKTMTWQKIADHDIDEGPFMVSHIEVTLENKEGEQYETSVVPNDHERTLEDVADELRAGGEWADIDFTDRSTAGGRPPGIEEVANEKPF